MGARPFRPRLAVVLVIASIPVIGVAAGEAHAAPATVFCEAAPPGGTLPDRRLDSYEAITPQRLVDTRNGTGGVSTPLGAACTLRLDLDQTTVPVDAAAVSLSVTAIASQAGFLTVYPCATGLPLASNVNPRPGFVPTPNLVIGTPDANREICIFTLFESDLLIDLAGWWAPGPDRFAALAPERVVDTRIGEPGPVPANTERAIPITGTGPGVGVPVGATAASVNLTVTEPGGDGFLVAYPCGTTAPVASNLNFRAGESRAVAAIVGLDTGGHLCVQSNVAMEVIVDINGYYAPAPQFGPTAGLQPMAGSRIASSRDGIGGWTEPFVADTVRAIDPVAALAIAPTAMAVTINLTALDATAPGFATVYPCGGTPPVVSSVNFVPGSVATNLVTVDLSRDRTLCFVTSTEVDLIVDLFAVFTAPVGSLVERLQFDGHTWPPFTPTGTDYAVECGADGSVDLDIESLAAVTTRINGLAVQPGELTLDAAVDDLLTIDLRRGAARSTYFFRCLPTDFPRLDVRRTGETTPGWYLTSLTGPSPANVTFTTILDHRGAPVWYKRADTVVIDVKRRSDGRIVYTPQLGATYGVDTNSGYRITSLSGTLLAEHLTVDPVNNPVDHHDYVELSGGRRAMIAYPLVRNRDLRVLGPGYFVNDSIVDGVIQEVNADGSLEWSFRVDDHFGYDEVTFPQRFAQYPGEPNGGEVDVWHINSLDAVDDGSGDYVFSARHLDAVVRVDRATESVDWILGSLPSGANRLDIVGDPLGGPRRPHDARLDGDVLTLFDNRAGTGQPARAVAYEIDDVAGTATLLWQISNPTGLSSSGLGSVRVAADGSVLVDWGGGLQPMFQEFDASRTSLMTISQVGGGASYRIVKEPVAAFDVTVLRSNAGGSAEAPS